MSYCRFSTDDYQCDVYCYDDAMGGFTTHVATARFVYAEPLPPPARDHDLKGCVNRMLAVDRIVEASPRALIGGPFDGATFSDPTLDDFLQRLLTLREAGYRIPDYVFEVVREEIVEQSEEQPAEPVPR